MTARLQSAQVSYAVLKSGFINCSPIAHIWYSHNRNSRSHMKVLEIAEGCNKLYKTRIFLGAALVPTGVTWWQGHSRSLWMNSSDTESKMTLTQMDLSIGYMWILLIANKSWWLKLKPRVVRIYQHMKQFHLAL